MQMHEFLAALVIAMLGAIVALALYDGLRGNTERQRPAVTLVEYGILAVVMLSMLMTHHSALAWGTLVGGGIAILAMIIVHKLNSSTSLQSAYVAAHTK